MYVDDTFSSGDYCLLFLKFDIDPVLWEKLPIEICPGIHLDHTPQHALAQGEPSSASAEKQIALGAWVYPEYDIFGICNSCIKIDRSIANTPDLVHKCVWRLIRAFFLQKPLYISVASYFQYGDSHEGFIQHPCKIDCRSNIFLDVHSSLQYTQEDITQVGKYFVKLDKLLSQSSSCPRPFSNLQHFFKATLLEKLSFSSSIFHHLFACLDSFVGNPCTKHCKKVSERVAPFLAGTKSAFSENPWSENQIKLHLEYIWKNHRNSNVHGWQEPLNPSSNLQITCKEEMYKDLFDLMEILRMAIKKMLFLNESSFNIYCEIPIPTNDYSDKKSEESKREGAAKDFFEKNYQSPDCVAYTDLERLEGEKNNRVCESMAHLHGVET